jgi:hypothetical protein
MNARQFDAYMRANGGQAEAEAALEQYRTDSKRVAV